MDVLDQKLRTEISVSEADARRNGRRNHRTDLYLSFSAIVCSVLATAVAAGGTNKWVTAALAFVPALATGLQAGIKFAARSGWYFSMAAHLRTLGRSLEFEGATAKDVSAKLGKLETDMEEEWDLRVGAGATAPADMLPKPPEIAEH